MFNVKKIFLGLVLFGGLQTTRPASQFLSNAASGFINTVTENAFGIAVGTSTVAVGSGTVLAVRNSRTQAATIAELEAQIATTNRTAETRATTIANLEDQLTTANGTAETQTATIANLEAHIKTLTPKKKDTETQVDEEDLQKELDLSYDFEEDFETEPIPFTPTKVQQAEQQLDEQDAALNDTLEELQGILRTPYTPTTPPTTVEDLQAQLDAAHATINTQNEKLTKLNCLVFDTVENLIRARKELDSLKLLLPLKQQPEESNGTVHSE
jgi:chromosome segregation ATPase